MSTTEVMNTAQRRLAEHAYELKKLYNQTFGMSKKQFLELYDQGEIQLSSVFENLLAATRNCNGMLTEKISVNGYDFVKVDSLGRKRPLGDMKTCTLQKEGPYRRYLVKDIKNKEGYLYIVGYNWISDEFNYYAVPTNIGLPVYLTLSICPDTGGVNDESKYAIYSYDTWEEMALKG